MNASRQHRLQTPACDQEAAPVHLSGAHPYPQPVAIPTEREASARSSRGPRHARFFWLLRVLGWSWDPHSEAKHRNVGTCALVATEESAPPKAEIYETACCCIPHENLRETEQTWLIAIQPAGISQDRCPRASPSVETHTRRGSIAWSNAGENVSTMHQMPTLGNKDFSGSRSSFFFQSSPVCCI